MNRQLINVNPFSMTADELREAKALANMYDMPDDHVMREYERIITTAEKMPDIVDEMVAA